MPTKIPTPTSKPAVPDGGLITCRSSSSDSSPGSGLAAEKIKPFGIELGDGRKVWRWNERDIAEGRKLKIDLHLASYASRWTEDFTKLHDWVKEHEERLRFLEKTQVKK